MTRLMSVVAGVCLLVVASSSRVYAEDNPCIEVGAHEDRASRFDRRGRPALGAGIALMAIGATLGAVGVGIGSEVRTPGDLRDKFPVSVGLGIGGAVSGAIGMGFAIGGGVNLTLAQLQRDRAEDDELRCSSGGWRGEATFRAPSPTTLFSIDEGVATLSNGQRLAVHKADLDVTANWTAGEAMVFSEGLLLNRTRMEGVSAHSAGKVEPPPPPGGSEAAPAARAESVATVPVVSEVAFGGALVALDNGETYEVAAEDQLITSGWRRGAQVVFDSTEAKLINLRDLSAVRARPTQ